MWEFFFYKYHSLNIKHVFAREVKRRRQRRMRGAKGSSFYSHILELKWTGPACLWRSLTAHIWEGIKNRDVKFWHNLDSNLKIMLSKFGIDIFDSLETMCLFGNVAISVIFRSFLLSLSTEMVILKSDSFISYIK